MDEKALRMLIKKWHHQADNIHYQMSVMLKQIRMIIEHFEDEEGD